ncbi:MAG: Zn-dependent protease with chaperone function [Planctomycetota bacterium]|jgi:Zn-dependent protease with chaperone function
MGFLVQILLAIGVQALGLAGFVSGLEMPMAVPLVLGVPYVLANAARRAGLSGKFRLGALLARISSLGGVLAYGVAVCGLGWVQSVRRWTGDQLALEGWPEPGLLLCFAPFVLLQLAAIDAEVRTMQPPGPTRQRLVRFQWRMFLSALMPLLLYLVVSIALGWSETLRVYVEWVGLAGALFASVLLVLLGSLLPSILRNTWETEPLPPGTHRALFDAVAAKAAFKAKDVLLWKTGNTMANAAIVGLTPGRRVVLLSDYLLGMLDSRQLATVYGHEIGHAKRNHVGIFLGWALFFLLGGDLLGGLLFEPDGWSRVYVALGSMVVWYLCFGWLSRRFELEADLYSMQLTGDPEALIGALERVGGPSREISGWRHFSTQYRVRFLHRAAFDEVFRLRFLHRIRRWGRIGLVLGALSLVAEVGVRAYAYPEDRIMAQLALGDYAAAVRGAEAGESLDPEYGRLARLGSELALALGARVGVEDLEQSLEAALEEQNLELARDLTDLTIFRGNRALLPLADWLAPQSADEGAVRADLEQVPEPWRGRLSGAASSGE